VDGRTGSARVTLRPADAAELQAMIRDRQRGGAPLRLVGRGTWGSAMPTADENAEVVDLSLLSGIVEYVPGDLTLTARAGTTIAEIVAATMQHRQWCPLLPWGGNHGSLGATFATATHGPCSLALGLPRDMAIGMQFVDGTGALARGGGRVVKNVAGFDLTRLLVGSWGTLGAITEISVRLRARPAVDETWAVTLDPDDAAAPARLNALRRGALAPLACESLDARMAAALGMPGPGVVVRLGGNSNFVAAARAAVRELGPSESRDPDIWTLYRALDPYPRTVTAAAFADPLSQRIRDQFDPARMLNRFAGETNAGRAA
jgi:glycolate oxidase FAD binding subunit